MSNKIEGAELISIIKQMKENPHIQQIIKFFQQSHGTQDVKGIVESLLARSNNFDAHGFVDKLFSNGDVSVNIWMHTESVSTDKTYQISAVYTNNAFALEGPIILSSGSPYGSEGFDFKIDISNKCGDFIEMALDCDYQESGTLKGDLSTSKYKSIYGRDMSFYSHWEALIENGGDMHTIYDQIVEKG